MVFCQVSLLKGVQEGYTAQAARSLGFPKPPTSRLVRCAVPARKHYGGACAYLYSVYGIYTFYK